MSRIPLIAGNWKMYKTGLQSVETASVLATLCDDVRNTEIMIAPTFLSLPLVAQAVKATPIIVGAKNLHQNPKVPLPGEVGADLIKDAGAR